MRFNTFILFLSLSAVQVANAQNLIWAKQFGGSTLGSAVGIEVAIDDSGNVYTSGTLQGPADFDPGPGTYFLTPTGGSGFYICKLDSAGNFVWAKLLGGSGSNTGYSITLDKQNNIYVCGKFMNRMDFDPGIDSFFLESSASSNAFILKLNAAGNFIWAKQFGGTQAKPYSIAVDDSENVYTTGIYTEFGSGNTDFDPGPDTFLLDNTLGWWNIYINKFDASGNFVWAKNFAAVSITSANGYDENYSWHITLDGQGNVYTTGFFINDVDFDPGPGTYILSARNGSRDIFISKLNSAGNFIWAKQINSASQDEGISLVVDQNGNVYCTGYFKSTCDFDPGSATYNLTAQGGSDAFVCKLDASGNFIWAKALKGWSDETGDDIALDENNNVYISGDFKGTVDFDPGADTFNLTTYTSGVYSSFLCKLDSSGNFMSAGKIGGNRGVSAYDLEIDALRNIYLAGIFDGVADLDPSIDTFNITAIGSDNDAFILKLGDNVCHNIIGGADTTHINQSAIYNATGGSGYTWSVSNGTIISGQGTSSVQIQWAATGQGIVQVAVPGCPVVSKTVTLIRTRRIGSAIHFPPILLPGQH